MSDPVLQDKLAISKELFTGTVLRSATHRDIPKLIRLEESVNGTEGFNRWNIARWAYEITNNYVWLIEQNLEVIYVVGFIHDWTTHEIDVIKLTAKITGQPFTGKLVQAGIPVLIQLGVNKIRGRCADHLLEFYRKLGFIDTGIIPHYFGLDIHAHSIERVL